MCSSDLEPPASQADSLPSEPPGKPNHSPSKEVFPGHLAPHPSVTLPAILFYFLHPIYLRRDPSDACMLSGPLAAPLRKRHTGLPAAEAGVASPAFPQPVLCVWAGQPGATQRTVRQASLSITNSRNSLRLMSIESVMSSSHLILCPPLLLLPPGKRWKQ